MSQWTVTKTLLSPPSLQSLVPIIKSGVSSNFAHVSVSVTPCPDLREPPFHLAAPGLSGNERIADIGGPPYLSPTPNVSKKYSLFAISKLIEMRQEQGFLLGASAGPFHILGYNSELVPNLSWEAGVVVNETRFVRVDGEERGVCERLDTTEFGLMANLFGCDGSEGDVLKITAQGRTGSLNFTGTIQEALKAHFGERTVSLGGVFLIRKGKAKLHVMPDFSNTPLESREEVERWLRYFDVAAPLVCLSVFHSSDPGLGLRMEHTHCFSGHGEGGHYHDDVTPDEVEYEAYFNVAKVIYRIDRPESIENLLTIRNS